MIFLAFAESIQLVPDGTLFIHIALILLMIFVLNRTLFKPINRILEERERSTRGGMDEARDTLRRIEENLTRYERSLREARAEGYSLLEQQRAEALTQRQQRLSQVREELEALTEREKEAIRRQAEEARATLAAEAQSVAAGISRQILGRSPGGVQV